MNVTYILKNTTTKQNKYVVNQNFNHFDDVSFSEYVYQIRLVPTYSKVLTLVIFVNETHFNELVLSVFIFKREMGVDKSNVLML